MGTPKRVFGPALLTNTAATKYTAPSYIPNTLLTVVRKIHFFNGDTSARTVTCSIGADAAGTRLLDAYSIPANTPYDLWGPITLGAAEIIQAFADTTNKVTCSIDAIENEGP